MAQAPVDQDPRAVRATPGSSTGTGAAGAASGYSPAPDAFVPGDRRRALASGTALPDRPSGAALFADISGFTPITEALAQELGDRRGAEELTRHLNRILAALIDELDRFGGDVIYFSGDAITCWLDGDDGSRATACALAMQHTMGRVGEVITPRGTCLQLGMKAAVAVGAARRFLVGDPAIQVFDILAGRMIDALAASEQLARRAEVVLDASALDALGTRLTVAETRFDASGRRRGVVTGLAAPPAPVDRPAPAGRLPEHVVRPWLLPGTYERLRGGQAELAAELRSAYPLFVAFAGIDYDRDDGAIGKLDAFVRSAQHVLAACGGTLLHLTVGDKGAYLFAVFGPPQAHEDDAVRAATAALELVALAGSTAVRDIRIGLAHGRLRIGTCGHPQRQTFTCHGDAVNLAARLMSAAAPGQVLVSEAVRRSAGAGFEWDPLPPTKIKGRAEPVNPYALVRLAPRGTGPQTGEERPAIVGRRTELDALSLALDRAIAGHGAIVGIAGEAGMGKSRLADELAGVAPTRGMRVLRGECQSFGTATRYLVWRPIWSALFGLDGDLPPADRVRSLHATLETIGPSLVPRAPLLTAVLDVDIPDNDVTRPFDAKLRKISLEGLLVECLIGCASRAPTLIILEDTHWIDALSKDLLIAISRAIVGLPVLLLLAYRPEPGAGGGFGIERLPHFEEMSLAELAGDDARALIASKLAGLFGSLDEPPQGLVDIVLERSQGNPFYIEELLNFIGSQGVSPRDEAALKRLELPESLHTLIQSRIDMLGEGPRRTLKVASVLGRTFHGPILPEIHAELGPYPQVRAQLDVLGTSDLVRCEDEVGQAYCFRHVVTRQVAYESMPFAVRSTLHGRVGDFIERTEGEMVDRNLDLLAYHYGHSENLDKKREYLRHAAEASRAAYANAAAIDYYERLEPLVDDGERVGVLLDLGKVLELVGNWPRAEEVSTGALALAQRLGDLGSAAACETALAEVARKQGRYDEALERLGRAEQTFRTVGDDPGVGRVLHVAGTVAAQRGDYDRAVECYQTSLEIRQRFDDRSSMAALMSNLGVIAEYRGDYPASRAYHERALELRREIGDRWAIAVSMINLGMIATLQRRFDEAGERFDQALRLSREVGDGWMVALCQNNLGNTMRARRDTVQAGEHYAQSLRAYWGFQDRWALAFLLEDVAVHAAMQRDAVCALELIGAADASRTVIGAPRAPSLDLEIEQHLATAAAGLPEDDRAAARDRGRALDLGAAVERALAFCRQPPG
jgi:class 3 adenylate cyclase/tetratricopeptide (TPR) repeat protein